MKIIKVLLLIILMFISKSMNSQNLDNSFYLTAGLNYSNMLVTDNGTTFLNFTPYGTYTNGASGKFFKYGSKFGLGFQKRISNSICLQIEANYERKGGKIKIEGARKDTVFIPTTGFSNVSLDYIREKIKTIKEV